MDTKPETKQRTIKVVLPEINWPEGRQAFTMSEVVRLIRLPDHWRLQVQTIALQNPAVPHETSLKTRLFNREGVIQIQRRFAEYRLQAFPGRPLPWDVPRRKNKRRNTEGD